MPEANTAETETRAAGSGCSQSPCSAGAAFGQWLKEARTFHGMSLDELSATARVSKSQLSEIENGNAPAPSLPTLQGIANAFGSPLWRVLRKLSI